jgi:hypothetical protein
MSDDGSSAKVPVLMGMIALIIYLTARNSGLYPMIFAAASDKYFSQALVYLLSCIRVDQ